MFSALFPALARPTFDRFGLKAVLLVGDALP
jgi:hypothetical protein